jgi:uncharacterized protein (TIGR03067 family)
LVRQRPLVVLALILASAPIPIAFGQGQGQGVSKALAKLKEKGKEKKVEPRIERRPYRIRAWVAVDARSRLDAAGRDRLVASWRALVKRFVGAPWDLDVAEGDGPLADDELDDVQPKALTPLAEGFDKLWLVSIGPRDGGYSLSAREFDAATKLLGPTCHRPAPDPADAPRALFQLALDVFTPMAEIGESSGGGVSITVQGAALPAADPVGRVAAVGSVFRPVRLYLRPNNTILKMELIRTTYLRVDAMDGAVATCNILSAYRDPLRKAVQKTRMLALGIKPSGVPTRLRFVINEPEKPPAAGYTLHARSALPNSTEREVGTTDREGRVVLPPGFSDGLVILRLLAADVEPLVEFPLMPGESVEERTIVLLGTRPEAVAVQTRLNSLRNELIDLVAKRKRLEYRLKARAEGEAWDEVKTLLDEYHQLPTRASFSEEVQRIEGEARRQQNPRTPILTKATQTLLTDTKALIDSQLDDDLFRAYEEALQQAQTSGKAQGGGPALAEASPKPAAKKAAAPKAGESPAPSVAAKPPASSDNERIQGTWRLVATESEGQRYPSKGPPDSMPLHIFHAGSFTYQTGGTTSGRGNYRIDASQTPKAIDFIPEGQAEGAPGIYELQGDRLRICSAAPGSARPTSFVTKAGSGTAVYSYERVGDGTTAPPATVASQPPAAETPPRTQPSPKPEARPATKPATRPPAGGSGAVPF